MLHMLPVSLFAVFYSFTSRAKVVYVRTPFIKFSVPDAYLSRKVPLNVCVCVYKARASNFPC